MFQMETNVGNLTCDKPPNHCPVCLRHIVPLEWAQGHIHGGTIDKVYLCPNQSCKRLFIARYKVNKKPTSIVYVLSELLPVTIATTEQSDTIMGVSPDFASIFGEAEIAEQHGLKLICGPGYRKALEFLIKDYAIRSHQNESDQIKKLPLAQCIKDYVSDTNVKQVASRAVWLGNDETHYERKWDDKDLSDLKTMIALTLHWIEMDELTKAALNSMPQGKP